MKKKRVSAQQLVGDRLDAIKQTAIAAMFADDELMDVLVLKGGNAMDLIHRVNARASVDLDFSIAADLDVPATLPRVERALRSTFELEGLYAFDIKMSVRPGQMPDELASFWGGYLVEFKLIAQQRAREAAFDLETLRREAIRLGEGTRFTIDISRHEYVTDREAHDLNGYRIYVYSPEMIVCEKLRAICQQMPEYGPMILRSGGGHQRARDFVDITALIEHFQLDVTGERAQATLRQMFAMKRVPLSLLGLVGTTRELHAQGFESVKATMRPGVRLHSFDEYFDGVLALCQRLQPLWDV